jgi:hypothetical protein
MGFISIVAAAVKPNAAEIRRQHTDQAFKHTFEIGTARKTASPLTMRRCHAAAVISQTHGRQFAKAICSFVRCSFSGA